MRLKESIILDKSDILKHYLYLADTNTSIITSLNSIRSPYKLNIEK